MQQKRVKGNTVEARMIVWQHTKSTVEDFASSYCTIIHKS